MATYGYIDISQKQEYIYKDSKLIDNLCNSFTIKAITEKMELKDGDINFKNTLLLSGFLKQEFEGRHEFIYSGGGNSIIRFDNYTVATDFVKKYSYKILKHYPELELYISLVDEDEVTSNSETKEMEIRKLLIQKLDKLKDRRKSKFKRGTFGIEQIGENGKVIEIKYSTSVSKSENMELHIREYLFKKFDDKLDGITQTTSKLNDYKKDEQGKSYIGIISIDGNGMGKMVQEIKNFGQLGEFSKLIDNIYFEAIIQAIGEYNKKIKNTHLYITPILQAGDDICIITESEHAIDIAATIIKKIEEISSEPEYASKLRELVGDGYPGYLTACGGVAIVRYTYPFFEAVKIAESLCNKAKESIYLIKSSSSEEERNSFIDWEIVQNQVNTGIEYETYVKKNALTERYHIKPLCIKQSQSIENDIFSYDAFYQIIKKLQNQKADSISNSFLEKVKKRIYNGKEEYKLLFDENEKVRIIIEQLSKEIFWRKEI